MTPRAPTQPIDADTVSVALVRLSERRMIETINTPAEALFGVSRHKAEGRPLADMVHADAGLDGLIDRAISSGGSVIDPNLQLLGPSISDATTQHVCVRVTNTNKITLAFLANPGARSSGGDMFSLANFGSILGHEVKNPLAGLSGAAQLLLRNAREDQQELLTLILTESERITRLIDDLSAFELFSNPRLEACNIHAVLEKVICSEQLVVGKKVEFVRNFDPSLPEILGDADHLHEVFQNLVRNACEAFVEEATVAQNTVTISTRFSLDRRSAGARTKSTKRFVKIVIADNGPGIPVEAQDRIFEMFHTSKPHGGGLGLTIVNQIVGAHNGYIYLDSEPGATSFSIYLPIASPIS